ncbi:Cmx/CmrA family chloramphenicol efflux MFS transporter [Actinomadura rupiterrae]|uniref:Cmx/CmrA family chloramphenicol efflux MFS transporter n=1 Tax=Actinomadura rupiterrae TaxID=559627 RepID=UPI0020A58893|nr:Cmx/CmrA family chloramphenicol efflux MFS transporter [Actinomadura rupiterrae]MCP2336618.1 DHA1 family chloramphenicol resistance protein-like MFS transporter [Actinomadura rupiterrae]
MPLAVWVLGFAIFAQGTSEFLLAGLLEPMARDLHVTVPTAGLLISAYAVGMVAGAPVLSMATLRWPRRRALLLFLTVFAVAHVVGALTPGYAVLFASRLVGAIACAGFFGVAMVTAVDLVPGEVRARALAVVIGGITVATVFGVPAGTFIGQYLGWRAAFWAVAALTVPALAGVYLTLSGGRNVGRTPASRTGTREQIGDELRSMKRPALWIAYGTTALSFSSMMATFGYLGPLLTGPGGLGERWVPMVLALFGVGSLVGITIGGRVADAHPFATLYTGLAGVVATSAGIALTAGHPAAVTVLVFLMGVAGMATNPAVNVRVHATAGPDRTLAGASVTSAFNVGNAIAPWLAGLVVDAGLGYANVPWVGAAMAAGAFATVVWASRLDRRPATPTPSAERRTLEPAATDRPV